MSSDHLSINNLYWKRFKKTTCQKRYRILFIVLAITFIAGLITTIVLESRTNINWSKSFKQASCTKDNCIHTSNASNLITPKNLCPNFQEYIQLQFSKQIHSIYNKTNIFSSEVQESIDHKLKEILEKPLEHNLQIFSTLKTVYRNCVKIPKNEDKNFSKIKGLLKKLGGWPILEYKNWIEIDWVDSLVNLRASKLRLNHFLNFQICTNSSNNKNIISVSTERLQSMEVLKNGFKDSKVLAYQAYLVDLGVYFGTDRKFSEYETKNLLDFRIKLIEIEASQQNRSLIKISQLQHKFPTIKWLKIINAAFGLENQTFTDETVVQIDSLEYVEKFEKLLKRTSKRTQINHVIYEVLYDLMLFLPEKIQKRKEEFDFIITGKNSSLPKWKRCLDFTSKQLRFAIDALYFQKCFRGNTDMNLSQVVNDVQTEFLNSIKKNLSIGLKFKKSLTEKINFITSYFKHTKNFLDNGKIENYYSELQVDTNSDLLDIDSTIFEFLQNKMRTSIWKNTTGSDWKNDISTFINKNCQTD